MQSVIRPVGMVLFPSFEETQLYMHPFRLHVPLDIPPQFLKYWGIISQMIKQSPITQGIAHLTIDSRPVKSGTTHRRPGPHVDGNYIYDWNGGGGGGWLTGEDGRFLPPDKHREQYCSPKGGTLIVSNHQACSAWIGDFDKEPLQGGNCEHIDLTEMIKMNLEPGIIYLMNSTCIHESLPVNRDVDRTLIRITLPPTAEVA